jgi:hypothetical protein
MCKLASFVITKGPKVWWSRESDSHEDIIFEYNLNQDGCRGPNVVRAEISPEKGNLSLPLPEWRYKVDQDLIPDWYDAVLCERETKAALKDWAAAKLNGWNVKETFAPVNPLKIAKKKLPKKELLRLLESWAAVRESVLPSVWLSVRESVGETIGRSMWNAVWNSTWNSVRISVKDTVGTSVRYLVGVAVWVSVWRTVEDSVHDSVWAYISSLFPNIKVWKYAEKLGPDPWRPLLTLWYAGYTPSFDGKTWRLHAGENAAIVLEWSPEKEK